MKNATSETAGANRTRASQRSFLATLVGYAMMILGAVVILSIIHNYGTSLVAPPPISPKSMADVAATKAEVFLHILVALTAVIVTGLILAKCFAYIGQPPVIGEVVAGIVLGPSLLGSEFSAFILPPDIAPFLGIIAQLGVLLYMFSVGLELHTDPIRRRLHATIATSHASILLPFVLGATLALGLYPRLSTSDVSFASFALFMGVAMSITAFPVLARILTDRRMNHTELGVLALTCAATDDVTAWCLLALVVGVAQAEIGSGLSVAAETLGYILVMVLLVRPILKRIIASSNPDQLSRNSVALVFIALLLSSLTTEYIGIHAIFGAFLLGAVIPHDSIVARTFTRHLDFVVTVLLLPAFFAFTGMRTRIDLMSGIDQWLICALIIVVATVGKFGGTLAAARLTGLDWRTAAALGTLMNTRGLMELIVLNVGLDLKVISPTLFAMMVLMALVTTMMTSPLLGLLMPSRIIEDKELK
jgi:Kef-type K+ transport system membrane component KefB